MKAGHDALRLGVISDTHGLLRPEVLAALKGVTVILHAGDVGSESVLQQLAAIAPVIAIRGNVDTGAWAAGLPFSAATTVGGDGFYLIHNIADLPKHPAPQGTRIIVYGHSHKPLQEERQGVTYLNPGSAGRRRFSLPVTLVIGHRDSSGWVFSLVDLLPPLG